MNRHRAARTGAVACLATTLALSTGVASAATPNGEAAKPAKTVLADAVKALQAVKTVKVSATIRDDKQSLSFAFTYVNGKGETGSFSEGKDKADIITIGRDVYFRGNAALIGGGAGSVAAGRWVHFTATSSVAKEFSSFTNLKSFASSILMPTKLSASVGAAKVGQTPAVVLTDSDGSKLYVAGTGAPVPLKVSGTKSDPGTATFTGYNAKVTLKAPADSITIKA